ncbi:MAG: hypothetical protein COA78_32755 [Blastopirellula sp.]|nr:MAG: hypothetical protein COA78_32755 [Blastopirellula sp.]
MIELMNERTPEAHHEPAGPKEPLQFRLVHLMYFMAMIGSSIATFGIFGVYISILIGYVWVTAFFKRTRPSFTLNVCLVIICTCCLLCMIPIGEARNAAVTTVCQSHLNQLSVALMNYEDTYGTFPPAYIPDKNGKPMHSWRVLLLPFFEQNTLYAKYDFNEPWDGPNNIKLLDQMPDMYACPTSKHHQHGHFNCTSYVAVIGKNTAWPGATGRLLSEIKDDKALMLVECDGPNIPWLEPRDLQYEEALKIFTNPDLDTYEGHNHEMFDGQLSHSSFHDTPGYRYVLGHDRISAYHVGFGVGQQSWEQMINIDDGVAWDDINRATPAALQIKRWKLGNCFRLAIFIVVMLLPFYCRWVLPFSKQTEEPQQEPT